MTIVDMILHACWNCKATWLEDDRMYEEPDRCPHCGKYPDQRPGIALHGGGSPASGEIDDAYVWDDSAGEFDDSAGIWEEY